MVLPLLLELKKPVPVDSRSRYSVNTSDISKNAICMNCVKLNQIAGMIEIQHALTLDAWIISSCVSSAIFD
jgi:hypothetical protein